MKRVCLIGNNNFGKVSGDGQRVKTRVWLDAFEKEKIDLDFVELEGWKKHPFSLFLKIMKGLKHCDVIILMAASNGTKILVPLINVLNKKYKRRFVVVFIGLSSITPFVENLSPAEANNFIIKHTFAGKADAKMARNLKKVTLVLVETEIIQKLVRVFYGIDNCKVLNNFRFIECPAQHKYINDLPIKLVYISRVSSTKGIFDLLNALCIVNKNNINFKLDIFGPKQFDLIEMEEFDKLLEQEKSFSKYCGVIDQSKILNKMRDYDALVFPTRYMAEGTPGILSEALLTGLPVISSAFPQHTSILKNGFDSMIFDFCNVKDLEEKLLLLAKNPELLNILQNGAIESGKRFSFMSNRTTFLNCVFGEKNNEK